MPIAIAGILLDPYGNIARFADIRMVALVGSGEVIETANSTFRTDDLGAYSINVQFGRFAVYMRFNGSNGSYTKIQAITVNSSTIASTLGELLSYTEPLTPEEILIVQALVAEAVAAKNLAEAAALSAALSATNSANSATASASSANAAANSVALLAPVPLNGGVWSSGQIFTAYNQYMIYSGQAYSPLPATTLPYTVGAAPNLGFVYQIKLNSHPELSNLNAAGGHDAIYNRSFLNVAEMTSYTSHAIGNKYSTGRSIWEVTATVGVPLGGGLYATSITPVDPIDFGADPTGIANSTTAFTDASLYASTSTQWSFGTYKLKDYNILENQHIVSYGATIMPLDNTSTAVIANAKSGWSLTGKTTFRGSRATLADTTDTGETGLKIIDGDDFKVENVNFIRHKGLAFDRQGVTGAVTEYYGNRGQYNNIFMFENLQGGKDSAEYEVYTNLNVIANVKGFESVGGNISWNGGNCTNNTDGFLITTGPNNAHGIATGVHFNHNLDRNIYINRTGDGFTFDGCHSYANDATGSGKIEIVQSGGIDFCGGAYDCWFEVDETFIAGIGDNFIRDIFAPGGYGNLKIFNHLGNRAATMLTSGIRGGGAINLIDGLNVNDVAPIAFLVKRAGGSSQTLTDSVETVMTFPEIRPMGDTRGALSAGAISTFPTPYKGYYSVNLDAVVAGTTLDTDASYIAVYVDGVVQGYFYGRGIGTVSGKIGMKFTISAKAYAESSVQFKAYAVGTDLVHAISVFNSSVEVLLLNA